MFVVGSGVHLSLTNLSFANGAAIQVFDGTRAPQVGKGAAIQNSGGIVVAVNCTFTNNFARGADRPPDLPTTGAPGLGGAIWQGAGSLSIQGGSFISNRAVGGQTAASIATRGGAICADAGVVEISNASFLGNFVKGSISEDSLYRAASTGSGGAIALGAGNLLIMNTRFVSNSAAGTWGFGRGGAISIDGGSAMVVTTHFIGNYAESGSTFLKTGPVPPGDGAGLFNGPAAEVVVSGCTFENGISVGSYYGFSPFGQQIGQGRGGGIFNSGLATIVNSTLYGNAARLPYFENSSEYSSQETLGGAIYNDGTIGLTNVTVAGNASGQPILYSANGSFSLKNCLLGKNDGVTATNVIDAGHNLSATASPQFTATSSRNNLDLRLGPLADFGGPTPTISLLAGSPAIDAAEDAAAPATDQRGRARPYGIHADVGAFESSAPFIILGAVLGYREPLVTVTDGTTSTQVDTNGNFRLALPAGATTLTFNAANSIFDPASLSFDLTADMAVETVGFRVHGFGFDPTSEPAAFGFAGKSGETWRIEASNDMIQWTSIRTNVFANDNVFPLPITNSVSTFFRAIQQ